MILEEDRSDKGVFTLLSMEKDANSEVCYISSCIVGSFQVKCYEGFYPDGSTE